MIKGLEKQFWIDAGDRKQHDEWMVGGFEPLFLVVAPLSVNPWL